MAAPGGLADQLRNQLDIVEVIGSYLTLKKRGREYQACCPFHQEKTPSFKVNPGKQIFHCFGCHKGGDVIKFVMEFEHLDFRSAATLLAERHGLPVPRFGGPELTTEDEKRRALLHEIHQVATEFFMEALHKQKAGWDYLEGRGIDHDLAEAFQLGYAPKAGQAFLAYARRRGYSEGLLREAGLIKDGDNGAYDAFRHRVIFPISDAVGRVVAFGGRVLEKEIQPKYLNSPETAIYHKSQFLYAYHLAKTAIKDRGFAIVTEGYMDAIACHQYSFTNAVASLGTAFTDQMARLLKRVSSKVVFLYDGDAPGQKAMYSGTQILLAHDFQVNVVALPPEDDPDSLLRKEGNQALADRIARAPDHFDFFMRAAAERHDRRTLDGRVAIVEYLKDLVGRTKNAIAQYDYVRRLSEFLAVPESTISQTLFGGRVRVQESLASQAAQLTELLVDRHEIGLLRLLIEYEDARLAAQKIVIEDWLHNPRVRFWFQRLLPFGPGEVSPSSLLDLAEDDDDGAFLRAVLLEETEPVEDWHRSFYEIVAYLLSRFHDLLLRDLNRQIADAEATQNSDLMSDLLSRRTELTRGRKALGEARYGKWFNLADVQIEKSTKT